MECPKCENIYLKEVIFEGTYLERAYVTGKYIRKAKKGWRKFICGCGWESKNEDFDYDNVYEGNRKMVK